MFSAVNSVCWGPYDFGLILACGSSDGAISLLTFTGDQQWDVKKINNAHTVIYGEHICGRDSVWSLADLFSPFLHRSLQIGCNAVSWAPAVLPGSLIDQPTSQKPNYVKRFVSGGCDNLVKLWKWVCTLLLFFLLVFPLMLLILFYLFFLLLHSSSLFAPFNLYGVLSLCDQRGRRPVEGGPEVGGSQWLGERCRLGAIYWSSNQHHRQLLPGQILSVPLNVGCFM